MVALRLGAPGVIDFALDQHAAAGRLALAGQHFDQLALAVARHAGDADDLAGAHRQRHAAHRLGAVGVVGR